MDTLIANYHTGLVAMGVLALAVLVQSFIAGYQKNVIAGHPPGREPDCDYDDRTFRISRTFHNSLENLSVFVLTAILAMIAGADPTIVNGLIVAHVVLRLLFWFFYYTQFGKFGGGPRTFTYLGGWFANFALAIVAIYALVY